MVKTYLDSAQLVKFIEKKTASISDFGSGAGFPGINFGNIL